MPQKRTLLGWMFVVSAAMMARSEPTVFSVVPPPLPNTEKKVDPRLLGAWVISHPFTGGSPGENDFILLDQTDNPDAASVMRYAGKQSHSFSGGVKTPIPRMQQGSAWSVTTKKRSYLNIRQLDQNGESQHNEILVVQPQPDGCVYVYSVSPSAYLTGMRHHGLKGNFPSKDWDVVVLESSGAAVLEFLDTVPNSYLNLQAKWEKVSALTGIPLLDDADRMYERNRKDGHDENAPLFGAGSDHNKAAEQKAETSENQDHP